MCVDLDETRAVTECDLIVPRQRFDRKYFVHRWTQGQLGTQTDRQGYSGIPPKTFILWGYNL